MTIPKARCIKCGLFVTFKGVEPIGILKDVPYYYCKRCKKTLHYGSFEYLDDYTEELRCY